ncbi:MAG: hypothetical protein DYG99_14120 [Bacteroidetes bacterium CHB5]|nr:hypothetical protein [Bacteroidetes bacterium CHB5]
MKTTSSKFLVAGLLGLMISCASNDEPQPVDCSTTDLAITLSSKGDPTDCNTNNGSIVVTATGGASPYQFKLNSGAFASATTFNNLGPGSFTVVVKDANACEKTLAAIVLSAPASPVAGTSTIVAHTNCLSPDGSITVNVTGGTPPYEYKIGDGSFVSSNVFDQLKSGSYTITVQDDANCAITINNVVNSNTTVSFTNDIKPLIQTNCINKGCHNDGSWGERNWTVDTNLKEKAAAIKTRTGNKSMPKDIAPTGLPQDQIDLIACWVDSGASITN